MIVCFGGENGFQDMDSLAISEDVIRSFFNEVTLERKSERRHKDIISSGSITAKELYYNEKETDQMMNSIQNICLEAIENLDGILIATTNLAGNFCDEAFARRFIFKVEFSTPEAETRTKIWKSMIADISDDDACELGRSYAFSGGNIENIARKAAVGYVLSGEKASLADLRKYCDVESLSGNCKRARIGF